MNLRKKENPIPIRKKNKTQAANFRRCISSVRRVLGRISTGGLKTKVPRISFSSSSKAALESVEFHVDGWWLMFIVVDALGLILSWGCG